MNHSLFAVLCVLSCGAGWWIDARLTDGETSSPAKEDGRIPVTREEAAPNSVSTKSGAHASASPLAVQAVHTVEDLVKLTRDGYATAIRARLQVALIRMSAAEVAALARELALKLKEKSPLIKDLPPSAAPAVLKRWLDLDSLPALEFAVEHSAFQGPEAYAAESEIIQKLYAADAPAAMRLMAKIDRDDNQIYSALRTSCIDSLKGMPPEAALARIVEFDAHTRNGIFEDDYFGGFPGQWVKSDPQKAMTWALALPPSRARRDILSEMTEVWAVDGGPELRAFLKQVPATILPGGQLRETLQALPGY
jgi:hypothetical protein